MNLYHILGSINTAFIFISLIGVFSQLKKIWQRKACANDKESSTKLLSLNQFIVSYLAYFSFFVYGYSLEPFNHFIVWPRLLASLVVVMIIFEIWQDRKSIASIACLVFTGIIFIIGILGFIYGSTFTDESKLISTILIVIITVLIAQGYYHQIILIIRSRETGAVALKMSQFILMMDISTIFFALSMGLNNGWPLLLLASVSSITKVIIIYLFHWVKTKKVRTLT